MLALLVFLLCLISETLTCLQCDSSIRLMHEDFILSSPSLLTQIELKQISENAYVTYRETSKQRMGVTDVTTLYHAKTEYQSEFKRFLQTELTGLITSAAIQIMEKGRKVLEKHLDAFIPDGLCPNKCGLLNRRVMDCISCRYRMYICSSPSGQQDCGEHPVQAEEGGQVVLDCFLPWHRLLMGNLEYHYSWAPGLPGSKQLDESDFKALVVTQDSSVVLNQLQMEEQGTYRCSLQNQNRTIFYKVTFLLTGFLYTLSGLCDNRTHCGMKPTIPVRRHLVAFVETSWSESWQCDMALMVSIDRAWSPQGYSYVLVTFLPTQTRRPLLTLPSLLHEDYYSALEPAQGQLVPVITVVTVLSLAANIGLAIFLGKRIHQQRVKKDPRSRTTEGNPMKDCI